MLQQIVNNLFRIRSKLLRVQIELTHLVSRSKTDYKKIWKDRKSYNEKNKNKNKELNKLKKRYRWTNRSLNRKSEKEKNKDKKKDKNKENEKNKK